MKLGSQLSACGLEEIMRMNQMQCHHEGSFSSLCVTSSQYSLETDGSPELNNMDTK